MSNTSIYILRLLETLQKYAFQNDRRFFLPQLEWLELRVMEPKNFTANMIVMQPGFL